jgi:hypothetical protein
MRDERGGRDGRGGLKADVLELRTPAFGPRGGTTGKHFRGMLKKARLLTRPTLAVISPSRPESAKTASSPRDAPYPRQGRSSSTDRRFTVPGSDARTLLADYFSIPLDYLFE